MSAFETKDLSNELGNLLARLFILRLFFYFSFFGPKAASILDQKGVADCLLREFLVRGAAVAWALTVVVIVVLFAAAALWQPPEECASASASASAFTFAGAFNRIQLFLAVAQAKSPARNCKVARARSTAAFPQLLLQVQILRLLPFLFSNKRRPKTATAAQKLWA